VLRESIPSDRTIAQENDDSSQAKEVSSDQVERNNKYQQLNPSDSHAAQEINGSSLAKEVSSEEVEFKNKYEELEQIEVEINKLQQEYKIVKMGFLSALVHFLGNKWHFLTFGKCTHSYDILKSAKWRTRSGLLVENLTKLLLQLDSILSNGDEKCRKQRKRLVQILNDSAIPEAERLFKRANALLALDNNLNDTRKKSSSQAALELDHEKGSEQENSGSFIKEEEVNLSNDMKNTTANGNDTSKTSSNDAAIEMEIEHQEIKAPEQPPILRKKKQKTMLAPTLNNRKAVAQYSIDEHADKIYIHIVCPNRMLDMNECHVSLDSRNHDLHVDIDGYEALSFSVASPLLQARNTQFEQVGPHLLRITVPKLLRPYFYQPSPFGIPSSRKISSFISGF
jgi:hypothetical protein